MQQGEPVDEIAAFAGQLPVAYRTHLHVAVVDELLDQLDSCAVHEVRHEASPASRYHVPSGPRL